MLTLIIKFNENIKKRISKQSVDLFFSGIKTQQLQMYNLHEINEAF